MNSILSGKKLKLSLPSGSLFTKKIKENMIILISPAKSLDFESADHIQKTTQVAFPKETTLLVEKLKSLSAEDLRQLMDLSENLAMLNYERYQNWQQVTKPSLAKSALFAFQGDVYQGLEATNFDEQDLDFCQAHLRILSGLYGILKPFDLIQPYRLEMGTSLKVATSKNLYEFWGDKIAEAINESISTQEEPVLVNLASQEYFKSVNQKILKGRVITPHFKELKGDKYKIVSFFAKKARGMMAAFIIKNRIIDPEEIKNFDAEGYCFNETLSKKRDEWVFTR